MLKLVTLVMAVTVGVSMADSIDSNGRMESQLGDTTIYSDGSTSTQLGDATIYSNGRMKTELDAPRQEPSQDSNRYLRDNPYLKY